MCNSVRDVFVIFSKKSFNECIFPFKTHTPGVTQWAKPAINIRVLKCDTSKESLTFLIGEEGVKDNALLVSPYEGRVC